MIYVSKCKCYFIWIPAKTIDGHLHIVGFKMILNLFEMTKNSWQAHNVQNYELTG